jgi:putative proteasome-type protease
MLIEAGLVMMADTRTNAGVDNISVYRKLHIYDADDRFIAICTAGNLSVTQSTLSKLDEGILNPETGEHETLWTVPTIFRAVQLVGRILRETRDEVTAGLHADEGISFGATMLMGGRVGDEALRLYMIYDAGNAIECHEDTPYLQIGEFKYGKPILDRSLDYATPLNEAVKIGLISFDSTMRSNLAVGLPIDMVTLRSGKGEEPHPFRVERSDQYFNELSRSWGEKLREAQGSIDRPPFIKPKTG